jgi:ubiquinone/menaquinone biosynthesis C-methylase UbiE
MSGKAKSQYDPTWVAGYFDDFGNQEWDRLVKSPAREIQLIVHQQALLRNHKGLHRWLEIGAGPGRFTQMLVELDKTVTVTDISSVQLDLNRAKAKEHGFDRGVKEWRVLDVCDMSCFDDESFDAVVAFGGPLSYVLDKRDIAIQECMRVVRPGGMIFLGVMSLWGTVHQYLPGVMGYSPEDNERILATGDLTKANDTFASHYCHMFRSSELREFLVSHGLEVLDMSASGVLTSVYSDQLDQIRADQMKWDQLIKMELEACREPGYLDGGTHLIAVARKPG